MLGLNPPLPEILAWVCRMVERQALGRWCSIFLLEGESLRYGAAPTLPKAVIQALDGLAIGPRAGSCGTAAFRRETVIVSDISYDPLWESIREVALEGNLAASWSMPILSNGRKILGTVAMYSPTPGLPSPDELDLIKSATYMARMAVEKFQAERALRELRNQYEDYYEHAPVMYASLDPESGLIMECNHTLLQHTGYSKEEILGRSVLELYSQDSLANAKNIFEELKQTGESTPRLLQFEGKDGQPFEVAFTASAVRDESGRILHWRASWQNITTQLNNVLREGEGRLQAILDNSWAVIYVKDLQGKYLLINRQFETLFKLSQDRVKGQSDFDIFPHEIAKIFTENDRKVIDHGKSLELEELAPHKDGLHTYISNKFLLRNTDGTPYALCGISTDITQRKRVEEALKKAHLSLERRVAVRTEALREANLQFLVEGSEPTGTEEALRLSQERFRDLYDSAPLGYLSVAMDGIIWKANVQVSKLMGYSHKDLIGRNVLDLFAPTAEGKEKAARLHEKMMAGSEILGEELEAQRADGSSLWIDLTVSFVRDEYGRPIERRAMLKDVTDRHRMEKQIRQYNEKLEKMVDERTVQIRELESKRMQSEKLAALGQLAAGIAHEINNPLAGVCNGFLLIKDAIPKEHPMYPYVDMVDRDLARMTEIVENMYKLYGGGLGEGWLMPVGKVVQDVLHTMATKLKEREIRVVKEIPAALPEILILETDLAQVLTNLLHNAIDASPNGATIRMKVKPVGLTLRIEIADGGVGISPEVRSRIFEPFFTTKVGQSKLGMGLGLSVSNSLIENMGGRIEVESRVNEGSTFRVILPLEQKEEHV